MPCRHIIAKQPPRGPGWAHELRHDGYRLQVHVRDGRVRLYTMNAADWTARYPRVAEEAARIKGSAILDAEVVCLSPEGVPDFDALHSRTNDHAAVACAFDLLMRDGHDLRRRPLVERKAALGKLLFRARDGIQYVEHAEGQRWTGIEAWGINNAGQIVGTYSFVTPLPSALPLFATGLGALGLLGWRRKRKTQAAA